MVKTDGATPKAQTHFEQVPLDIVKKVLGGEAVRTHRGTIGLGKTEAVKTKRRSPAGSIAKAAIKSKSGRTGRERPV